MKIAIANFSFLVPVDDVDVEVSFIRIKNGILDSYNLTVTSVSSIFWVLRNKTLLLFVTLCLLNRRVRNRSNCVVSNDVYKMYDVRDSLLKRSH